MERLFVWTGGGLFIGAIGATAWLYAVPLGRSMPGQGWSPLVIDAVLLTMFAAHHSLFARASVKHAMARAIPERMLRSVYVWVASLLLIGVCVWWQPMGHLVYDVGGAVSWALLLVQGSGVWMTARSVRSIHPLELAGIRPPSAHDALQVRGSYALVRHPLYLGWVLIVFGAAHMTADRLAFAVLTTLYLVVAIPWEEASLQREFGASYTRYKERVRWRIVPYLY